MRPWLTVLAAFLCCAPANAEQPQQWYRSSRLIRVDRDENRPLATRPPAVVDWHHTRTPPVVGNGRLWMEPPVTRTPRAAVPRPGRGPDSFGAAFDEGVFAFAKVGTEILAFDPWERFGERGFETLDEARALWLREAGLTGGVRSFVNPIAERAEAGAGALPTPSGWFRRPSVLPRTKPVEQVRFSLPPGMPPHLASALSSTDSAQRRASR